MAENWKKLWDAVSQLKIFRVYQLTSYFYERSSFSANQFDIKQIPQCELTVGNVLDFDASKLELGVLLQLANGITTPYSITGSSEKMMFYDIVKGFLAHLCSDITLSSKTYYTWFHQDQVHQSILQWLAKSDSFPSNISVGPLGMGSSKTWHGEPDARGRGLTQEELEILAPDSTPPLRREDSTGSNGNSLNLEAKKRISKSNYAQCVSTAVVSSFIETNKHGPRLTPVVLIDDTNFVIVLYSCTTDTLIISDEVEYCLLSDSCATPNTPETLLLWLVINHRYALEMMHSS